MIRKPSSTSSGVSRPDSPMSSGSGGSSPGNAGGSRAGSSMGGSRAGTSAGTRVGAPSGSGNRGQSIDAPMAHAEPPRRPTSPVLVGVACAGWALFVIQWVLVITLMINRGDTANTALAQAPAADAPKPAAPAQDTPQANTPAQIPANPAPAVTPPTTTNTTPAPTPTPTPAPAPTPAAPVLSDNNPFGMTRANVLGFELNRGHTAVLFDAIAKSEGWLDDGKAALMSGLTRPASSRRVSLVATSDGNASTMLASPFAPGAGRFTPLNQFLRPLQAVGKGGLAAGLDAALDTGADEVVFITSRSTGWGGYLGTLRGKLKMDSGSPVKLHIIQIGDPDNDLRRFVENENKGTYLLLTEDQLRTWRRESR